MPVAGSSEATVTIPLDPGCPRCQYLEEWRRKHPRLVSGNGYRDQGISQPDKVTVHFKVQHQHTSHVPVHRRHLFGH